MPMPMLARVRVGCGTFGGREERARDRAYHQAASCDEWYLQLCLLSLPPSSSDTGFSDEVIPTYVSVLTNK